MAGSEALPSGPAHAASHPLFLFWGSGVVFPASHPPFLVLGSCSLTGKARPSRWSEMSFLLRTHDRGISHMAPLLCLPAFLPPLIYPSASQN